MTSIPHPRALLAAIGLAASSPANAAFLATLAFVEPTGTVAPDESIPVWLTLTLDPASDPLAITLDSDTDPPFGVPLANYPDFVATPLGGRQGLAYELVSLDTVLSVTLNVAARCAGTLIGECSPGAYAFDFNLSGPDSLSFRPDAAWPEVALAPGESLDFLLGTFVPTAPVAAGTYTFFGAQVLLEFGARGTWLRQARDANGAPLVDASGQPVFESAPVEAGAFGRLPLGETACFSAPSSGGCEAAFSRTVVPLPPSVLLLLTALAALPPRHRSAVHRLTPGP